MMQRRDILVCYTDRHSPEIGAGSEICGGDPNNTRIYTSKKLKNAKKSIKIAEKLTNFSKTR
jgi:hypothetical protein